MPGMTKIRMSSGDFYVVNVPRREFVQEVLSLLAKNPLATMEVEPRHLKPKLIFLAHIVSVEDYY